MPRYITNETYAQLIADLSGAFMAAATCTNADLRDKLAEALAVADLLPDSCREEDGGCEPQVA